MQARVGKAMAEMTQAGGKWLGGNFAQTGARYHIMQPNSIHPLPAHRHRTLEAWDLVAAATVVVGCTRERSSRQGIDWCRIPIPLTRQKMARVMGGASWAAGTQRQALAPLRTQTPHLGGMGLGDGGAGGEGLRRGPWQHGRGLTCAAFKQHSQTV